jgi:hypothetical protein
MSSLPEHGHGGGGSSAFADFLSRLRPYPPPPGFRAALLYAARGSVFLLIAAGLTHVLQTDLEGDGFHTLGAAQFGLLLEVFQAPSTIFLVLGLAGLVAVALVGTRGRISEATGGILTILTMLGVAALLWAAFGWLLWVLFGVVSLLIRLMPLGFMGIALFRLMHGDIAMAVVLAIVALATAVWLEELASDPASSGSSQSAGPIQREAPPLPVEEAELPPPEHDPPAEPPPVSPAVEQRREQAERRQQKREALTQRRIALEARIEAESAAWSHVPYVSPCNLENRRGELESLRQQFARMKRELRSAEQYGETGVFRKAAGDLERVRREREHALADPASIYERFGRCPGAGAMAYGW